MKSRIFKGKNAPWFYGVVILYNVLPILCGGIYDKEWYFYILLLFYYCMDYLFIPILIYNEIEVNETSFTFTYGFQKTTYQIRDVKSMKPTRNPIASSANSLDRIYMDLGGDELCVALQDNDGFMQYIKEHQG